MSELKPFLSDLPISNWNNAVNSNIRSNQILPNKDISVRKGAGGTTLKLKPDHQSNAELYIDEWDPDAAYDKGERVRVLPTVEYKLSGSTEVINATPGIWQCCFYVPERKWSDACKAANLQAYYPLQIRSDTIKYYPRLPEPSNIANQSNPDGRYWESLGCLPIEKQVCVNGNWKTAWIDMTLTGSTEN